MTGPPHSPPLLQIVDRSGVREPAIENTAQNKKEGKERGCRIVNRTKRAKKATKREGDQEGEEERAGRPGSGCVQAQAWA